MHIDPNKPAVPEQGPLSDSEKDFLTKLPREIKLHIFEHLSNKDAARAGTANQELHFTAVDKTRLKEGEEMKQLVTQIIEHLPLETMESARIQFDQLLKTNPIRNSESIGQIRDRIDTIEKGIVEISLQSTRTSLDLSNIINIIVDLPEKNTSLKKLFGKAASIRQENEQFDTLKNKAANLPDYNAGVGLFLEYAQLNASIPKAHELALAIPNVSPRFGFCKMLAIHAYEQNNHKLLLETILINPHPFNQAKEIRQLLGLIKDDPQLVAQYKSQFFASQVATPASRNVWTKLLPNS